MPTYGFEERWNFGLLENCRREVAAQMRAAGFQIGQKFDNVLRDRACKLYRKRMYG